MPEDSGKQPGWRKARGGEKRYRLASVVEFRKEGGAGREKKIE